jgi:hypothetical protein
MSATERAVTNRALISLRLDYGWYLSRMSQAHAEQDRGWIRPDAMAYRAAARNAAWILSGRLCYSRLRDGAR